jgi:hypothetical protein
MKERRGDVGSVECELMKRVVLFLLLMLVAAVAAGFVMAIATMVEPEHTGVLSRWIYFSWRYGLVAGVVAASLFLWFYRRSL